jgi:hypothetical protein
MWNGKGQCRPTSDAEERSTFNAAHATPSLQRASSFPWVDKIKADV